MVAMMSPYIILYHYSDGDFDSTGVRGPWIGFGGDRDEEKSGKSSVG